MSDWIDFAQWSLCDEMARPGVVFEVVNADGQVMLTECTPVLEIPTDWKAGPIRFRPIPEPVPTRSKPIPLSLTPR